jgi:hypothetical protein
MRLASAVLLLQVALSSQSNRKCIDLQPLANTTYAAWVFMSVIMLPPLSCGSVAMVPRAFDDALLRANPDAVVRSEARRLGSAACVAGACPCAENGGVYSTIVLVIETRCGVARLALPTDDEFLFVYDARTDMSRRSGAAYGLLPSFADYVLLRLVDTASVSSLTFASSSAMR